MPTTDAATRVRYRRTKSVTRAEEIQHQENKARKPQPDKPCHTPRDSLFSSSSGFDNFVGFVNWAFLLLAVGGISLLLENLLEYGIRVDPRQWIICLSGQQEGTTEHPSVVLLMHSAVPVVICLLVEKSLSEELIPNSFGMFIHVVNLLVLVLIPIVTINVKSGAFSLVGATAVCMLYSILFLKLWSYVQVNLWCRSSRGNQRNSLRRQSLPLQNFESLGVKNGTIHHTDKSPQPDLIQYPENLNIKDLCYYILAPTLCYELNFPRTTRIRKRFLLKRMLEVLVGFQVMMSLCQQWIIPYVKISLIPFSNMDVAKATERLLKLAIPNHLIWLIGFYLLFHSFLNLVGELLHFADRNFYCDWWNANNIDIFWRTWNMPVHRWAVRHLYLPLIEMGYGRTVAIAIVFFVSAFFHEYLVSVPLRTFKTWAFLGMMGQVPLSMLSRSVEKTFGPRWSNIIVWGSLILGQPLCIMMYYHDYVITHHGEALLEAYGHV